MGFSYWAEARRKAATMRGAIVVRAVGKIQAGDVHPGMHQLVDHLVRRTWRGRGYRLFLLCGDLSRLFGHREIIDDCEEKFNAFVKRIEGDAFVVGVKAGHVIVVEREGNQAVGLHVAQAQRSGIGGIRGHERNDRRAGVIFGGDARDRVVENRM